MNSVQQTILGLVLVGIAFIFGSYLHRDSDTQVADNQVNGSENLQWQDPSAEQKNTLPNSNSANQAMPSLNPEQSSMPNLVEANLVPDLGVEPQAAKKEATPLNRSLEVVEPDFSQFAINESNSSAGAKRSIETSAPQVQQPNFESHFPQPIMGTVENIRPKMPERDQSFGSQNPPTGVAVTETRLKLNAAENPSSVLETNDGTVQPQMIQNNHYRGVQTTTVVTSIRPRNSSPVMKNTQEYRDHETVAGETLQNLAVKYFGDPAYYLDIYVANKDVLRSPSELPSGITLRIPVY